MAVRFDAAADRLLRTANLLDYDANYSASFWVYFVALPGSDGTYQCLFTLNRDSTSQDYDYYGIQRSGVISRFCILTDSGTSYAETFGATTLSVSTWYHVGIIRSATNSRVLYLNGVSEVNHTTTVATTRANPTRVEFGAFGSGNVDAVSARVANIKLWATNLALADIVNDQRTIRPLTFTSLHIWSPTFPGATVRAEDKSGNGYNWTESGTLTDEAEPPIGYGA